MGPFVNNIKYNQPDGSYLFLDTSGKIAFSQIKILGQLTEELLLLIKLSLSFIQKTWMNSGKIEMSLNHHIPSN